MKSVAAACVFLVVGCLAQQQQPPQHQEGNDLHEPKTATRILKADVLRDFPNMCFGSTTCRAYPEGATWNLEVFCGQATCIKNETGFFEKVEDCGIAPKPNEQCQPIVPSRPTPFPGCCPKYTCLPGATLEYFTEEELKRNAELAQAEAEAQAQAQANGPPPTTA